MSMKVNRSGGNKLRLAINIILAALVLLTVLAIALQCAGQSEPPMSEEPPSPPRIEFDIEGDIDFYGPTQNYQE